MSEVHFLTVGTDETALRLDRWFRRHFPELAHNRLEKLLRKGQVRVDGKRIKAGFRLEAGQKIRIPPNEVDAEPRPAPKAPSVSAADAKRLRESVLYKDDEFIAINKPSGLAVQGGTKTLRHLDGMLDALRFEKKERPRLVHRLDRDTSGVLMLARNAASATWLATAFREKTVRKIYWALVCGVPRPEDGEIKMALSKQPVEGSGERVVAGAAEGKPATTQYAVLDKAGSKVAWLALMPLTGRTHQLRVHCAALGVPILGDYKYGGPEARFEGEGIARRLHLHAREIEFMHHSKGKIHIVAPLPEDLKTSWDTFGFESKATHPF